MTEETFFCANCEFVSTRGEDFVCCPSRFCNSYICADEEQCTTDYRCECCERRFCKNRHLAKCAECHNNHCKPCTRTYHKRTLEEFCSILSGEIDDDDDCRFQEEIEDEQKVLLLDEYLDFDVQPLTSRVGKVKTLLAELLTLRSRIRKVYFDKYLMHDTRKEKIFQLCVEEWGGTMSALESQKSGQSLNSEQE